MSHDSTPISTPEGSLYTPTESSSSSSSNLSFSQASFLEHPASSQTSVLSDATSSTSSSTSNSDTDDDDDDDEEAEAEWQESLRELNMLVSLVVIPFFGKWVGRKCAYWVWERVMAWKHPVDIVVTNRGAFNAAGAISIPAPSL